MILAVGFIKMFFNFEFFPKPETDFVVLARPSDGCQETIWPPEFENGHRVMII